MYNPPRVPLTQIKYLEKYRVYDLFHELARELVIHQPADHVSFIKEILSNAIRSINKPRFILIGSQINVNELAQAIAKLTKQHVITQDVVVDFVKKKNFESLRTSRVAEAISIIAKAEPSWIITCAQTEKQAKALLKVAVIPTHLLHVVAPNEPDLTELLYCDVPKNWPQLRRELAGIRAIFKDFIREVLIMQRTVDAVVDECVEISRFIKSKLCIKPRIVLLGDADIEIDQARLLQNKKGLVHVDATFLRNRYMYYHKDVRLDDMPLIIKTILNTRILEEDCLTDGWVMTGLCDYDFCEMCFCLELPPNRVIFLNEEDYTTYVKCPTWTNKFGATYIKKSDSSIAMHESILAIITSAAPQFPPVWFYK